MTNPDTRVQQTLPIAVQLVGAVRDCDRHAVAQLLAGADLPVVAVTLAAMVDDEQRITDLLSWTEYDPRLHPLCDPLLDKSAPSTRSAHGTRSRYNRGCRGEACTQAERDYQHARYLREVAEGKRPHVPWDIHRSRAETRHAADGSDCAGTVDDMQRQAS